ncbi:MAG: carbohydrate ABC transporter permease [Caldilineaceae bacterium]
METGTLKKRFSAILSDGFLVLYFLFALFPIVWMLLVSLKSTDELFTTQFIFTPTLDNYVAILFGDTRAAAGVVARQEFPRYFLNSLIASTGSVILSLLVGVPAAYALARYNFRGKEDLAFTYLSFRFAPELVVIIPLSVIYRQLGLYDTYFGIIWVYQLITLPLLIWVLRSYFEDISPDIEQAAMIDGYPWWRIFWNILLPLVRPGLAARSVAGLRLCVEQLHLPAGVGRLNVRRPSPWPRWATSRRRERSSTAWPPHRSSRPSRRSCWP